ncbi:MAG: pyridoxamine 5'-phosphate oxidase family protein [Candidatus Promineifilaceae bacterium]
MKRNPARWRAIDARLGREMTIWVATTRSDGRPHLTPVWYVWLDERIYIAIGVESQKIANLRRNQSIAVALPSTENVVILEGEAHLADRTKVDLLGDHFFHKYEWDFRYDETEDWRLVEITPHKILAWGDGYDDEGTRIL